MSQVRKNSEINVLIADDDATTRLVLRLLLQEHEFNVIGEATNGEKAVELCCSQKPQIAFLDIDMPRLDGKQAAKKIRAQQPNTSIIIVSAVSTADNVKEAAEAGASAFVVKPFTAGKLIDAIDTCLKKRGQAVRGPADRGPA